MRLDCGVIPFAERKRLLYIRHNRPIRHRRKLSLWKPSEKSSRPLVRVREQKMKSPDTYTELMLIEHEDSNSKEKYKFELKHLPQLWS